MATIAEENAITTDVFGREYWLDYNYSTQDLIHGFVRRTYYEPGETVQFSIDYASAYTVQIYRLGYYGGPGGRKVAEFAGSTATQPTPVTISASNGAVTCSAWSVNVSWAVPSDATPGWYQVFLVDATNNAYGQILFCVADTLAKQPILVVSSDATWHAAYSGYGGNNVYGASTSIGSIGSRALCSTYDKPVITHTEVPQTHFFNGEVAQLRFFERFGYDVGYATCEQVNDDPTVLDGRDLIVFSGHNEYVSARIRDKVAERIAAGVNVANFAANDFFWKVRYGGTAFPTDDVSTGRVMWCIAAGELVTTARGKIPIEQVRESDLVLTRDGFKPVQHVTRMGRKGCVKVTLSDGRTVLCTPDHRIALASGGWRTAGSLKVGDRLIGLDASDDGSSDALAVPETSHVISAADPESGGRGVDERRLVSSGLAPALEALSTDVPPAVAMSEDVLDRELVTLGAAGRTVTEGPVAPDVLAVRDKFKMGGVDAELDTANVIEGHTSLGRQGADQEFVDNAVRLGDGATPAQMPVVVVVGGEPEPVSVDCLEVDLRADSVGEGGCIHVSHITVVSVENEAVHDTYDIGVEGTPEFVVNGVVVHNCKKDTMAGPSAIRSGGAGTPFTTQADWTGTWQDTRWTGRQPSSGLLGDRFIANGIRSDAVTVPFALKGMPIWRDCDGIDALTTGQNFSFGAGTAGMEWDMPDTDGGLRQTPLSATVVDLEDNSSDINGENYNADGVYTHAFQVVANGSSRIFNANTTQWGWALDDLHFRGSAIATDEARQATLNILADLGAEAVSSLVTAAGLTVPTPVADFDDAYQLGTPPGLRLGEGGISLRVGDAAADRVYLGESLLFETAGADVTPPSVPTGLASSGITSSTFQVTWSASTDENGVTGYQVRLDGGSPVAANGSLAHTFSGLTPETAYDVEVRAGDLAGNWSAWSTPLEVTTSAAVVTHKHFFDGRTITSIDAPVYGTDLGANGLTGISFYSTTHNITVHGVRVYTPAGASLAFRELDVTALCWAMDYAGAYFVDGTTLPTPAATKTLTTTRNAGEWVDILFDTPVAIAAYSVGAGSADIAMLGLRYPAGQYLAWSTGLSTINPGPSSGALASPDGDFHLSERNMPRTFFTLGGSPSSLDTPGGGTVDTVWYGADIICTTTPV